MNEDDRGAPLTLQSVAQRVQINGRPPSQRTVRRWLHQREDPLPATNLGGPGKGARWVVYERDLEAWLARRSNRPPSEPASSTEAHDGPVRRVSY